MNTCTLNTGNNWSSFLLMMDEENGKSFVRSFPRNVARTLLRMSSSGMVVCCEVVVLE